MSSQVVIRRNTHANSWYEAKRDILDNELTEYLEKAGPSVNGPARVIIAPHAGYRYCGPCAAHAYKEINPENIKRIFLIGPSHHVTLDGCALTSADYYQTPLYNLKIDKQTNHELNQTNLFQQMSMKVDEDEHSIEMLLPFVAKVMEGHQFEIVPILVGSCSSSREVAYGDVFSRYLAKEENPFVISSDFCHWGSRFDYQYHNRAWGAIYESIEKLDRMGMDLIETSDPAAFKEYLHKYRNTICGRNTIILILNAIQKLASKDENLNFSFKFLNYAQSSKSKTLECSSVSYAAASLVIDKK